MKGQGFSTGQLATLACMLEVTIPKPGNVHRGADFDDTTLDDFLLSAIAIGPSIENAATQPIGRTVLECLRATRRQVNQNTNLGMILLMVPIAAVDVPCPESIRERLERTNQDDARDIFEAIRLARPGGLGKAPDHDVLDSAVPGHILEAMRAAADRDTIARQYSDGFQEIFEFILPEIERGLQQNLAFQEAVIDAHVRTMHAWPDSLIARKCGLDIASESARRAGEVLQFPPGSPQWLTALENLDFWLRSDGNRRNPGTTADLIAAAIFAGLRMGKFG